FLFSQGLSLAVRHTLYDPFAANLCVGFLSLLELPSPKFQLNFAFVPFIESDLKLTVLPETVYVKSPLQWAKAVLLIKIPAKKAKNSKIFFFICSLFFLQI